MHENLCEQNPLKTKKLIVCQRISSKVIHFGTVGRGKPNLKLVKAIVKSDACMKFEQNPLRKVKVFAHQRISLNDGHFVGHLGSHES